MEGVDVKMSVVWRPIPNYEGFYWVSNMGQVKNANGKMLSRIDCGGGILKVKLQARGQRDEIYLSTLMVQVFPELMKED